MPKDNLYRLHSVSVVVTAESHNPSILNPDFLVSQGIVPETWKVAEAITIPPVSVVSYRNGIRWTVEQPKLTVVEKCGPLFQNDYRVYGLVAAYLEKLPHVPYRSLGLNCVVSIKQDDPERWLTRQFLKSGPWIEGEPKVLGMVPRFTLDAGEAVCQLSFSGGQATQPQGKPEIGVIIKSNMHHAGPLDVNGLKAAISQWRSRQDFVTGALEKFLGRLRR